MILYGKEMSMEKFSFLNPYIIADIGVNHEGDIERAKKMIQMAADAKCDAVKFQMYKADTIASKEYSNAYWDLQEESTPNQYELFQKYDVFNDDDYIMLAEYSQSLNIDFMVTPFDVEKVRIASEISRYIKIASADLTNIPLLKKCAQTKKPIIISTGASNKEEIDFAIQTIEEYGGKIIGILHCVLNYPLAEKDAHLLSICKLQKDYGHKYHIGYSDHCKPTADGRMYSLELATMLGSTILEKHFTDNVNEKGNDHYHSMNSEMMSAFGADLDRMRILYGQNDEKDLSIEKKAIENARRRIFSKIDIQQGECFSDDNLIPLRANRGLEIRKWNDVIGKTATGFIKKGTYICESDYE